jgi:thiamine biosynthesis lipoprotein
MISPIKKKKFEKTEVYMDTYVTIKVITEQPEKKAEACIQKAFQQFYYVERVCSRFDAASELRQLSMHVGAPVKPSELLFQALAFAVEMAKLTDGAFDPSIGQTLEKAGFNTNFRSGEKNQFEALGTADYRDILVDEKERSITLSKPMVLDLGAVAKGLAVDLAVKELAGFESFVIDAGGDLYVHGLNENDVPWRVGIQHPHKKTELLGTVELTDSAVCTSGNYERISEKGIHHLLHPHTSEAVKGVTSCTVIAPFTMLADAFSTAVFIMCPQEGLRLLEENGLEGILMTSENELIMTKGMERYGYAACGSK